MTLSHGFKHGLCIIFNKKSLESESNSFKRGSSDLIDHIHHVAKNNQIELFSQQRVDHLIESIAFEVEATNFVIVSFIKLIH